MRQPSQPPFRLRGLLLGAPPWVSSSTVFDAAQAPKAVADLRTQGFHAGLKLPPRLVSQATLLPSADRLGR